MPEEMSAAEYLQAARGRGRPAGQVPAPLRGPRVDHLEVSLPWPPSANNLHSVFNGRKILSAAGRDYREDVAKLCKLLGLGHLEGRLYLALDVWEPDHRKRDIANLEKAAVDALVRCGTFADDSAIDEVRISRRGVRKGGAVVVTLWELDEVEAALGREGEQLTESPES